MRTPSTTLVNYPSTVARKSVISPTAISDKRFKKYHRKKQKAEIPKPKPAKVKLPGGMYFDKDHLSKGHVLEFMPFKKWCKKRNLKEQEKKKKLRGARKKETARLYKLKYPLGEPRASKPAPDHPADIIPADISRLRGIDLRAAKRYLTQIRKKLKKQRGEIVTLLEFCKVTPFTKEEVIPYMKR